MWLVDKLVGSDLNLKRPDFEAAPTQILDFSGNKLTFKDPAHTSMFPIHDRPGDMDIYNEELYEKQVSGDFAKRFYVKGWELYGKMGSEKGGVKVSGIINYFKNSPEKMHDKSDFEKQILLFCHAMWGFQNDSKNFGDKGTGLYEYPMDNCQLEYININHSKWCRFIAQTKGKAPRVQYATAISDSHIIFIDFTISTYKSLDFYSPNTNMEQASFKVIEDFMSYFKIELSAKSKQQLSEAESTV